MNSDYEKTALLMLPAQKEGSKPESGLLSWSRPDLIGYMREMGVDVAVCRGIKKIDNENSSVNDVISPEYSDDKKMVDIKNIGSVALNDFDVIRNILKMFESDTDTPTLNPNNIRSMARDKYSIAKDVFMPLDLYNRDFIKLGVDKADSEISDMLDLIHGDKIVAKPISGMRSQGVFVGSKPEIITKLAGRQKDYILEEKLNFNNAFPKIRAINEAEQNSLDNANSMGLNKELRMYYFGNKEWDSVVRAAPLGENNFISDEWINIDLETIPIDLIDKSNDVISKIQSLMAERDREFHIAIDWVFANSSSNHQPTWQIMEVNAAEPQLVQLNENYEVGSRQHKKLATQLSRIALR